MKLRPTDVFCQSGEEKMVDIIDLGNFHLILFQQKMIIHSMNMQLRNIEIEYQSSLTLSQTSPGFYISAVQVI